MAAEAERSKGGDYIFSLGGSLQWASEKRFAREMRMSVPTFRRVCKALRVPMICPPGTERVVSVPIFTLAMWMISRPGRPDFLMPGCEVLRRGIKLWKEGQFATELDLEYLQAALEEAVSELSAVRKLKGQEMSTLAVEVAREAARRMVEAVASSNAMRRHNYASEKREAEERGMRRVGAAQEGEEGRQGAPVRNGQDV